MAGTSDTIAAVVRSVAEAWARDAARRRAVSRTDPVADTLDYCASEIADQVARVEQVTWRLTVAQYAHREGKSAQTVRNWIRPGDLEAERDVGGSFWIPAHARRKPKGREKI